MLFFPLAMAMLLLFLFHAFQLLFAQCFCFDRRLAGVYAAGALLFGFYELLDGIESKTCFVYV